jgi:hypothetical protein
VRLVSLPDPDPSSAGVVKHKSKKRVNVGACVVEYEDERETGNYLERDAKP